MTDERTATTIPVGYYIAEEMHARQWTLEMTAYRARIPVDDLINIIIGESGMDETLATALARAFGTSDVLWRNLGGMKE